MSLTTDCIAALASPPGTALRGIIRISGREVSQLLRALFPEVSFATTAATRAESLLPIPGWPSIPVAVYFWPGKRSFTGEPLAELHTTGSLPVVQQVLAKVLQQGCRAALPGEFTQRAFLNGRIDLLQAEAVLGVIDAPGDQQFEIALNQLAGGLSSQLRQLREELLLHLADLEAGLDFVEEDIEFVDRAAFQAALADLSVELARLQQHGAQRSRLAGRPKVLLAGLPNAGKSTLFNRLTGSSQALVSPVQGTTRDFLQQTICWQGGEFDLVDTAGWEPASGGLVSAVQQQREELLSQAELILWCTSAACTECELELNRLCLEAVRGAGRPILCLTTQCDLLGATPPDDRKPETTAAEPGVASPPLEVSGVTGAGIETLLTAIAESLEQRDDNTGGLLVSSAARCRHALQEAQSSLKRCLECSAQQAGDELLALELRHVLQALGEVVGVVYTDDILDRIFSRFCIGK
jgi:tRNA modification GTPase